MSEINNFKFKLAAEEFINVWTNFCEEHTALYDLTCEEYVHLLSSDIDKLESVIELKNEKLEYIAKLDLRRKDILNDIYSIDPSLDLSKVSDVVTALETKELKREAGQLNKLNMLLLDIILKIQDQSKKNQLFLNKAILSLKDLKRNFAGKTSYTTYGANGVTRTNVTP